ncbi:adenine phosphoribosyltransferase [Solicola sp. PLA-1-18]|uniref:adenine phosphoribosyltransferase n=1 Tax=Solicola sp. PLA-1-18 TaxID=3380532 RepID=UPI003B7BA1F6
MTSHTDVLGDHVRDVADWPQPGVTFRDVTPLLADADAFAASVRALADLARDLAGDVDVVAGVEARGFVFGAPVAMALGVGFVPVRKAGKLPAATYGVSYDLEYGTETVEVHTDAFAPGQRVLVLDDVLATGGTLVAANELVRRTGAEVAADVVLIEIAALGGRARITDAPLGAIRTY